MKSKLRLPWKKTVPQHELVALEQKLSGVFTPKTPRPAFLESLEKRLAFAPIAAQEENRLTWTENKNIRYLFIGGFGLLSGTLLVITIARAFITILGLFGIANENRKKAVQTQTA